jgi:hypothetical protein
LPPFGDRTRSRPNLIFGILGTVCLLAILPIKGIRFAGLHPGPGPAGWLIGVSPSLLGPAGFLFLLLSDTGRFSRFSLLQLTLLVGGLSVAVEFSQLVHLPGVLARVRYTFDPWDLAATVLSVVVAYVVALTVMRAR